MRERTRREDVIKGYRIAKNVSKGLSIPIAFVSVKEEMKEVFKGEEFYKDIFPIRTFIKYPGER